MMTVVLRLFRIIVMMAIAAACGGGGVVEDYGDGDGYRLLCR